MTLLGTILKAFRSLWISNSMMQKSSRLPVKSHSLFVVWALYEQGKKAFYIVHIFSSPRFLCHWASSVRFENTTQLSDWCLPFSSLSLSTSFHLSLCSLTLFIFGRFSRLFSFPFHLSTFSIFLFFPSYYTLLRIITSNIDSATEI